MRAKATSSSSIIPSDRMAGDAVHDASNSSLPRQITGPTSPQSSLLASGQSYILFPTLTLESGVILHNVPLAYKTWGKLDPVKKNNALVVCHALTGSADVEDWSVQI